MYYNMRVPSTEDYGVTDWGKVSDSAERFTYGAYNTTPINETFTLEVDFTKEHPPRDFMGYIPVMSGRLIKTLKNAGVDNMQTYPAILVNSKAGLQWDDFFIVNVVGKIACADLDLSEGEKHLGGYDFDKLVINVEKAKGALFFRLEESHQMIIAHYDVARKMFNDQNEPNFRGIDFEPINSTHNHPGK